MVQEASRFLLSSLCTISSGHAPPPLVQLASSHALTVCCGEGLDGSPGCGSVHEGDRFIARGPAAGVCANLPGGPLGQTTIGQQSAQSQVVVPRDLWQEPTQNLKRTISSESKPMPRSRTRISRFSTRQSRLLCRPLLLFSFFFFSSFSFFFFFLRAPLVCMSEVSGERGERSHLAGCWSSSTSTDGSVGETETDGDERKEKFITCSGLYNSLLIHSLWKSFPDI